MQMKSCLKGLSVMLVAFSMVACTKGVIEEDDVLDEVYEGSLIERPLMGADQERLMATRIFYFDFDSSVIRPEDYAVLDAHAYYLIDNEEDARVRLEGYTDERGSPEYNMALGERRAQAVADYLIAAGVEPEQIIVVSYGEERPAVRGHDESAYRMNRRVKLVYETM